MAWYKYANRKQTKQKGSVNTVIEEITDEQIEGLIQAYEQMKAEYYASQEATRHSAPSS